MENQLSVVEKIKNGSYESVYPTVELKEFEKTLSDELNSFVGTLSQIKEKENSQKIELKEKRSLILDRYKENVKIFMDLFKEDLEKEFGVESNPKKDSLFSKAWSRGHSQGYFSVYQEYEDLVYLIK